MGQYDHGCETNFGRSFVSLVPWKGASILLYDSASKNNPPIARLKFGFVEVRKDQYVTNVTDFKLTYISNDSTEDIFSRLIEVTRVDEYGMPVLSYSPDSEWVNVALDCRVFINPPSAWLNVSDTRKAEIRIKSWANFFPPEFFVDFLCDSMMAFYSRPVIETRIFPKLQRDFCMRVIKSSGPWMQVYLESPCTFMLDFPKPEHTSNKSKNPSPKVWIKYLDNRGSPRIWCLWD